MQDTLTNEEIIGMTALLSGTDEAALRETLESANVYDNDLVASMTPSLMYTLSLLGRESHQKAFRISRAVNEHEYELQLINFLVSSIGTLPFDKANLLGRLPTETPDDKAYAEWLRKLLERARVSRIDD